MFGGWTWVVGMGLVSEGAWRRRLFGRNDGHGLGELGRRDEVLLKLN
jgi:hypothetical protein